MRTDKSENAESQRANNPEGKRNDGEGEKWRVLEAEGNEYTPIWLVGGKVKYGPSQDNARTHAHTYTHLCENVSKLSLQIYRIKETLTAESFTNYL